MCPFQREILVREAECVRYLLFFVLVTAVDEQNAQTSASASSLAEAIVTVAASAAGEVVTTSTARIEEEPEPVQGICGFIVILSLRGIIC